MKKNGFLSSALLYGMLALFLIVITSTLAVLGTRKLAMDKLKEKALNGSEVISNIIDANGVITDLSLATSSSGEIAYMYSFGNQIYISKGNKMISAPSSIKSADIDFRPTGEIAVMYAYEDQIRFDSEVITPNDVVKSLSMDIDSSGTENYMYASGSKIYMHTYGASGASVNAVGTVGNLSMAISSSNNVQYFYSYGNNLHISDGTVINAAGDITDLDVAMGGGNTIYYIYSCGNTVYMSNGTVMTAPSEVGSVAITADAVGNLTYMYSVGDKIYTNMSS